MLKTNVVVLVCTLFLTACAPVTLVQYQDQEYAQLKELQSTRELVPEIYRDAFAVQIAFWKDVYITHTWNTIVYFSPEYEVLDLVEVSFEKEGDEYWIIWQTKDRKEKYFIPAEEWKAELKLNVLKNPTINTLANEYYDELNELYLADIGDEEKKDIGMTRGRKEWYEQKFVFCQPFLGWAQEEFAKHKLPQDISFLVFLESGCNPVAVSNQAAVGIWQMIPATARKHGLTVTSSIDQRYDPLLETTSAISYLSDLTIEFEEYLWAINAYHSGEGNLRKAKAWLTKIAPDLTPDEAYIRVIQEFPANTSHNVEPVYFYGKNSARYTIQYVAMLDAYDQWKAGTERSLSVPKSIDETQINLSQEYWDILINRGQHEVLYESEILTVTYEVQSGDTLSAIAALHNLSVDELLSQTAQSPDEILRIGDQMIFASPKLLSLAGYLMKIERADVLQDTSNFCALNPSFRQCDVNVGNVLVQNGMVVFW